MLWSMKRTSAGSDFAIGFASPFPVLEISACSFARRVLLIGVSFVASDDLGDAVAIDEGGGGVSS